jgi:hypothetical protein
MKRTRIIGIDPGPTPGMVELVYTDRKLVDIHVVQCSLGIAGAVFLALIAERSATAWATTVQIEKFVISRRSARSSTASAGEQTRALVEALRHEAQQLGADCILQPAVAVKPWATDVRLEAAGLLAATKGMTHARDAGRHALFAACSVADLPDPLSKEWRAAS